MVIVFVPIVITRFFQLAANHGYCSFHLEGSYGD